MIVITIKDILFLIGIIIITIIGTMYLIYIILKERR
nr:MAG TPA: Rifin [Caudoviricetes sp.]